MKISFLVPIFLLFILSVESFALPLQKNEKNPKSISAIKRIVKKVKQDDMRKMLHELIRSTRPSRFPGTTGHSNTVPWLVSTIKKIDTSKKNVLYVDTFEPDIKYAVKLYNDDFQREIKSKFVETDPVYKTWDKFTKSMIGTLKSFKGFKGKNVIWEKKGSMNPEEVIVIGAHFDTIANNKENFEILKTSEMPGADDNASGVVVALKLIEVISEMNISKTVRVVFFDFEELGFLGSRAYVKKYLDEMKGNKKFAGYLNLEMLGNDSRKFDKKKKFGNMKIYIRKKGELGSEGDFFLAERLQKVGAKMTSSVKFEIVANSFTSSDHINFWDNGIKAITYTQDWENDFNKKRYHTPNDFVETLNLKSLYHNFLHISGSVIAWSFDIFR